MASDDDKLFAEAIGKTWWISLLLLVLALVLLESACARILI